MPLPSEADAQLKAALADRYRIERELGRGGMATVYLAHDLRHDRPVALKLLHPELAASLGADRFLREIRLAARLQHPHVLTVLDSGEIPVPSAPALLWFSMPFVRGESLRDRLTRERQLPVDDALRIAREAADALAFAHAEGVVHRDIKPENILLTGTHALVADFGIARALVGEKDERLTETGFAIGTPAYMSPEQASGGRDLDARADIYSLAVVLYEMLAGETPFAAPTAQAMIARRFTETARPVRQVRDAVPERIEQALQRALARTPADRFAGMAQFGAALEPGATTTSPATVVTPAQAASATGSTASAKAWKPKIPLAAVTLVLGLLIGLGVLFAWRRGQTGDVPAGSRLVAVLPFENVGPATEEYFADGITDAVRGKLTGIPGLEVIAGRSSGQYKNTEKTLTQIARELGVTHLVTAKIRWARAADGTSRVQVSPELVQVAPGGSPTTRWQQSFDAAMTDVFQVQADVAGRVAQELGVALADSARRELAERPTRNLEAYDLFLRAEAAALGPGFADPASVRTAIPLYERALRLDSTFALAWARLSQAKSTLYINSVPLRETATEARQAADRALALAPRQTHAVLAQASYQRFVEGDNEAAYRILTAAMATSSSEPRFLTSLAAVEQALGRPEASLDRMQRAVRLDPRSPVLIASMGSTLTALRRYADADSAYRSALELEPDNVGNWLNLSQTRLGLGDLPGAKAIAAEGARRLSPRAIAVYYATYYETFWALDSALQAVAVAAGPAEYDGDVGSWGLAHAGIYAQWGDRARSRAYADSARAGFAEQLEGAPEDAQIHALLGLSLAYLGRYSEAIRYGQEATRLLSIEDNADTGPYFEELLARTYAMANMPDKAVERLQVILNHPWYISRDWLRVDPHFAALREHPGFRKLIAGDDRP